MRGVMSCVEIAYFEDWLRDKETDGSCRFCELSCCCVLVAEGGGGEVCLRLLSIWMRFYEGV